MKPNIEAAEEVAMYLGISACEMLKDPIDWEYQFAKASDLERYEMIYEGTFLSISAKRLLACFILQALENHLTDGGSHVIVREALELLAKDADIHQSEFQDWADGMHGEHLIDHIKKHVI